MFDGYSERDEGDSKASAVIFLKIPLLDPRAESNTDLSGRGVSVSRKRQANPSL